MDRKSILSPGKPGIPRKQNPLQHQRTQKDENHECFKVETSDFPSLNEISVKSKNQSKTSVECSQIFSYSDKLKAPPQDPSSQLFKFSSNSKGLNKSEVNYNKIQSPQVKNNLLESKHHTKNNSQTKLDAVKGRKVLKSLHSFISRPNEKADFATGRRQLSNKSGEINNLDAASSKQIQSPRPLLSYDSNVMPDFTTEESRVTKEYCLPKKSETGSIVPIPIEETRAPDEEGWTVYQKHSSAKKNRMQDKSKETNISEKGFRANSRFTEQASGLNYKNEKNPNSPVKNKPTFNKYSEHTTSKYYDYDKAKRATNSSFEQTNERYRLRTTRELPYNNSSDKLKCSKTNPEVYNSLSTPLHSHKFKQTSQNGSGLDNNNRIRAYNKNITRNDSHSSNQNQLKSDNRVSSHDNKSVPSEPNSVEAATVKSKKKRKSKVKRLAALQAGKLLILTPEAHSRILCQSSGLSVKVQSNVATNVNDNEEYPELGLGIVRKINKEIHLKATSADLKVELPVFSDKYGLKFENYNAETSHSSILNDSIEDSGAKTDDTVGTDGKITEDAKLPVHSNNPISISLFDMLLTGKSKKKELEEKIVEEDSTPENSPVKLKTKKVISHPVNPLASSKLTAKRGKEREQPKVKKPTKMRKLILMGRQMKKKNMKQKDADIENDEKSDIDNDVISDDSSVSSTKSPGFEDAACRTALYDSPKDNSDSIMETLENSSVSVSSCKRVLFPDEDVQENETLLKNSCSSTQSSPIKSKSTQISPTEESLCSLNSNSAILFDDIASDCEGSELVEESEYKTFDKNIGLSCRNYGYILGIQNFGDYDETSSHELQNVSVDSQNAKICEVSKSFEEGLKCQLVENQDLTVDAYCNALVKSILLDCMAEIRLGSVKHFDRLKIEVFDVKSTSVSKFYKTSICAELSKNYEENKITECSGDSRSFEDVTESQLNDVINVYCTSLIQSILDDCFSEIKSIVNKNNFHFDATEKLTSVDNSSSINNLSFEEELNKLTLSCETENIEEFSKTTSYAANVTNISEDGSEKIDNDISFTINGDCGGNISEEKLDPLISSLENLSAQIEPEPLQSKFTDKEKMEAAKILLHSRKFRDYCTHFPTKELDETIFSLIDDLARFQDRMHQKDPVKAHVKRRLMYGIKEIKKHMKLKKLKGIIIATDIEDNKAEGGLNDLLKEVLSLSEAYHIPYVFSHKRFNLGKVCRKPAPVSCVGILNYEGSEKNFKKMLELQEESKCDYIALTKKIVQELRYNHIESLFETIQKSISPYEINRKMLKELFGADPTEISEKTKSLSIPQNAEIKIEPEVPIGIENEYLVSNKKIEDVENIHVSERPSTKEGINSEISDVQQHFGTFDDLERIKIHAILKKYNVIKT